MLPPTSYAKDVCFFMPTSLLPATSCSFTNCVLHLPTLVTLSTLAASHPSIGLLLCLQFQPSRSARCARAVHKICAGPYPSGIVVPSTGNNEPCYASK